MATSSRHRGWLFDPTNGRLAAVYNGTEIFDYDGNDMVITPAVTLSGAATFGSTTALGSGAIVYTWPAADGGAGTQLQTDGAGALSWAAAGSLRELKDVIGEVSHKAGDVLERIKDINIYEFKYKEGKGTGDTDTTYVGVMAEEAPEFMHHNGSIINPVNTLGELILAIKALATKVETLEAKLA